MSTHEHPLENTFEKGGQHRLIPLTTIPSTKNISSSHQKGKKHVYMV